MSAAPAARILRIDPRSSATEEAPIVTTVIELARHRQVGDATAGCATLTGNANLACVADRLLKPHALHQPFDFTPDDALLTVAVDGHDRPASLVSVSRWGASKAQDGVGTAWLIAVDAASGMGSRLADAREVAKAFVATMGPHDIVDVVFFNDRAAVKDSHWTARGEEASKLVDSVAATYPRQARARSLASILRRIASDGFVGLGNVGADVAVPLHQAMVVLSNGDSGSDVGSPEQTALELAHYLSMGRFPEDNASLPKMPVPIVSIWFPTRQMEELFQNSKLFMTTLANPDIGGHFAIVGEGRAAQGAKIVDAVRSRFDEMLVVRWRVPCVAPTGTQTIRLLFQSPNDPVLGDSFVDAPIGLDPTTWPLDVDVEATRKAAEKSPLRPGGEVEIVGRFCWGSDLDRARLHLLPKNQPAPVSPVGRTGEAVRRVRQQVLAANLVAETRAASDRVVRFTLPDDPRFLSGRGDNSSARLVVVDTRTSRSSPIGADRILTLPAAAATQSPNP